MPITVAEEGNRRKGAMSSAEEAQCALDIATWFRRTLDVAGADPAAVEALPKALGCGVPRVLGLLWEECDGGVWFGEKEFVTVERLEKLHADLERDPNFREGFLPFAADLDGGLLVVDTCAPGQPVLEFDEDGPGRALAASVLDFMEEQRNSLLSGRFEFVEDCGVVERDAGGK